MKKFILTVVGVCASFYAFAVYQYQSTPVGISASGTFKFDSDVTLQLNIGQDNVGGFGYYNVADGVMMTGGKDVLGSFKAGDEIGIWVMDKNGIVYTSSETKFGNFVGAYGNDEKNKYSLYAGPDVGIVRHEWQYNFTVKDNPAPSGQPLPGVIAALAVGGGLLAAKFRKNRAR